MCNLIREPRLLDQYLKSILSSPPMNSLVIRRAFENVGGFTTLFARFLATSNSSKSTSKRPMGVFTANDAVPFIVDSSSQVLSSCSGFLFGKAISSDVAPSNSVPSPYSSAPRNAFTSFINASSSSSALSIWSVILSPILCVCCLS